MNETLKKIMIVLFFVTILLIIYLKIGERLIDNKLIQRNDVSNEEELIELNHEGEPSFGNPNAENLIIYFYDYQCRWCREFDLNVFPKFKENYIDTGEAFFVFKDFAILGKDSVYLANAAECIYMLYGDERFLEYHLLFYENQGPKNSGWGSEENIYSMTKNLSWVNQTEFSECFDDWEYADDVKLNTMVAVGLGLPSTPSFFINGVRLSGYVPYEGFELIIDMEDTSKAIELVTQKNRPRTS